MTFPILGGNTGIAAYEIDNSLRVNSGDSASMTRTQVQQEIEKHFHFLLGLNYRN